MRQWAMVTGASMMCLLLQSYGMAQQVIPSETFSFQNGSDSYNGSVDTTIDDPGQFDPTDVTRLRVRYFNGLNSEVHNALIRFSDLPSGVVIEEATLTLTFQDDDKAFGQAIVNVHPLKKDWSDDPNTNWTTASPAENWEVSGAQGDPNDRGLLSGELDMGPRPAPFGKYPDDASYDIILSPDMVQAWIDNPTLNYGMIVAMSPAGGTDVTFSSSGDANVAFRPKLTIVTATICPGISTMDLTGDHFVNYEDFAILGSEWLTTYGLAELTTMVDDWLVALHPDINGDGFVDYFDFQLLNSGWQVCYDIDQLMDLATAWLTCTNGSNPPDCILGE